MPCLAIVLVRLHLAPEAYAVQFDFLFNRLYRHQGFRTYFAGSLLPRDRPKTSTAIAGRRTLGAGAKSQNAAITVF